MKPLIATLFIITIFAASNSPAFPELIFTKGTVYVYKGETTLKGAKNFKYTEYVKIENVSQSGVAMLSTGTMRFESDKVGNMDDPGICQFACDTVNFYIHTTNFTFQTVKDLKSGEHTVIGDSLIYPLRMKVGDTLPDAFCKSVRANSSVTSTEIVSYQHRKVEGLDTLNMAFGMTPAYRITSVKIAQSKSNSKYTGEVNRKMEENWTEWFSPKLGIIKAINKSEKSGDIIVLESYNK